MSGNELPIAVDSPGALSPIARLADIPEEEIWLAKQKSERTRRAYKLDVQHFMQTLHITLTKSCARWTIAPSSPGSASCARLMRPNGGRPE